VNALGKQELQKTQPHDVDQQSQQSNRATAKTDLPKGE